MNLAEETLLIFDMFQHIEKSDCWQRAIAESRFLQRRMHHILHPSLLRVAHTVCSRFDENHRHARLQHRGYHAVATADVKERSLSRKSMEQGSQAGAAVGEPE